YFAALGALAAYCDWRVIVVGSLATVLHHLALNYLMPLAVFRDGANFLRVLFHGAVVLAAARPDRPYWAVDAALCRQREGARRHGGDRPARERAQCRAAAHAGADASRAPPSHAGDGRALRGDREIRRRQGRAGDGHDAGYL